MVPLFFALLRKHWQPLLAVLATALVLSLAVQVVRTYRREQLGREAEALIKKQEAKQQADAQARCTADVQAAYLAGRRYEFFYLDSLSHAPHPPAGLPVLPAHPPRQRAGGATR